MASPRMVCGAVRLLLATLAAFALAASATAGSIEQAELDALEMFFSFTKGDKWVNAEGWLDGMPCDNDPSSWYGVQCTQGRVSSLVLMQNNLEGYLPDALGDLAALTELKLSVNHLHGPLPSTLGDIEGLEDIWFNDNDLTEEIPQSFENLKNLKSLMLMNNELSGQLSDNALFNDDTHNAEQQIEMRGNQFECPLPEWCAAPSDGGNGMCEPCVNDGDSGGGGSTTDWVLWGVAILVALVVIGAIVAVGALFVGRRIQQARQRQQIENELDVDLTEFE